MPYDIELRVEPQFLRATARGNANLPDNIDLSMKIIRSCMDNKLDHVLVDIRELGSPTSITEAYELGKEVASDALSVIKKAALLHGPDREELENFFQTTMQNRGINLCAFTDETAALRWLVDEIKNDHTCDTND